MEPDPAAITSALRLTGIPYAAGILFITWFGTQALTQTLTGIGNRFTDKRLLLNQAMTVMRFAAWLLGIAAAAAVSLNLSKEVVIALTGTAAVTIGFALKDLTASIIAGITIIVDRPFQVGDRVSFAGIYGEVSAIGLRSVQLVTLDDNVVTIPNNKFLTEAVSSGNYGALDMLIQMDFFVGVDQDIAMARRLVERALTSSRFVYLEKPWTVLVNQVFEGNYLAVRLRAKAYVLDVQFEKAFETDITQRVMVAFAEHGVLPPAVLHRNISRDLWPMPPANTNVGGPIAGTTGVPGTAKGVDGASIPNVDS